MSVKKRTTVEEYNDLGELIVKVVTEEMTKPMRLFPNCYTNYYYGGIVDSAKTTISINGL